MENRMENKTNHVKMYIGYSPSIHSHIFYQPSTDKSPDVTSFFYEADDGTSGPLNSNTEKRLKARFSIDRVVLGGKTK